MAINKKLIHFLTEANFNILLAAGNILDTSIVFIQDANKIYTHGTFYDGSTVDLSDIENSIQTIINNKVDKVSGKGLSTNDYTTTEKNKLAGIASGAEVNVQSDWGVTDTTSDAYIKNKPSLATVATSGSYNDLSNKPSIDSALSTTSTKAVQNKVVTAGINAKYTKPTNGIPKTDLDSDVLASLSKADTALQSYTEKYTGTYSKPSTGIPKSDLASAVLTSLGKADTALLSIPSEYITEEELAAKGYTTNTGTVTAVKINGTSKSPSNGVVDLGTVIVAHQDISGKLDSTTAASTYLTKTDAASTYLGKSAKAASATKADSATKATQDASGNVITSTYATKTEVSSILGQINTLVSGDADTAIESFNEIIAFLEGVEDTETLDGIIAGINTEIAKKADKSSAITNITRSGTTFTATRADGTTFTFNQQDNNTTYTFAGGTNLFTVTPSGGTAQTVTVTPSISKNVTYTGTLVDEQVATFEGTTGTIKASGFTIGKSVPSNAVFTDNNTIPSAYCSTAAGTAAKTASCSDYVLTANTYLHLIVTTANTAASALTLNVNGKGAKNLYINGSASSSSNYTLPAGSYIVYYDGTQYQLRTDGVLPGKILAANNADTVNGLTVLTAVPANAKFTDNNTTYSAGKGLTLSSTTFNVGAGTGISVADNTVGLAASGVTAGTYGDDEATRTLTHSDVFDVPQITVDAYGRITSASTKTLTLPASGNTDTKVTSVGNHYTPAADDNATLSADASSTTAATWGSTDLVTGVNILRDAKGHVTGVTVDSILMPTNPNTNTTYTFANGTGGFTVTPSGGSAQTVSIGKPSTAGTADKATQLSTARTIDGVDFNGTAAITHYGECSTAAGTAAKTISLTGYKLVTGSKIAVKFTVTNTAANPTLNVNSTGAKAIVYRGSAITAGYLAANRVYEFVYDGTDYELIGDINTDTKVTNASNHYTPSTDANSALSVDANSSTAASWGSTSLVTGVNLQRDSKGHVTGMTVDSIKMPSNPNTNTTYTFTGGTNKFTVTPSGGSALEVAVTPSISNNVTYNGTLTSGLITILDGTAGKIKASGYTIAKSVPSDAKFTDTTYTAGNGLSVSGTTFSHADTSTLSGNYGPTADVTGSNGKTIVVPQITVDGYGHVTAVTNRTYTSKDTSYSAISADELNTGTATTSRTVTAAVLAPWVKSLIDSKIAAADAMIYKGTIGSSGATITELPSTTAKTGWTYKVATAGTYAGVACEVGDMIICLTDGSSSTAATWTVVLNNIDGAVTGPTSVTSGRIAVFDGTTGKIIKDSGYTIAKSVPSNAVFTDTNTKVTSVANHYAPAEDTSAAISAASGTATNITGSSGKLNVVTGLKRDAKGHIVGVTSANIYSTDNNTQYSSKAAVSGGSDVSLVTTGEKYTWNSKASTAVATTSANGLMSSTDKSKLDGIASGATAVSSSTVSGWGYTKNAGTVTSVATGVGLTGGSITSSGTVKAKLRSETALTVDSAAATTTSGRVYPVAVDKTGYLAVNVPWTDTNTLRSITDSVSTTSSEVSASATAVKSAYDKAVAAYNLANGKTSNTGTVTSVATGAGLTGGTITGSGTLKAALKSETKSTLEAAAMGSTSSRQYAVGLDKNGVLSVNVPWTNTTYTAATTSKDGLMSKTDKSTLDGITSTYATKTEVTTGLNGKISLNGTVTSIIAMTQADYDALATKDATTLYIITD